MILFAVKMLQRFQSISKLTDFRLNTRVLINESLVPMEWLTWLHYLCINGEGIIAAISGSVSLLPSRLHCFTVLGKEVRHCNALMLIIFKSGAEVNSIMKLIIIIGYHSHLWTGFESNRVSHHWNIFCQFGLIELCAWRIKSPRWHLLSSAFFKNIIYLKSRLITLSMIRTLQ